MRLFHITSNTLTAAGRGHYSIPDFAVKAATASAAIETASKITMCDKRTSDGILWTYAGVVRDDISGESKSFSIVMADDETPSLNVWLVCNDLSPNRATVIQICESGPEAASIEAESRGQLLVQEARRSDGYKIGDRIWRKV